MKTLLENGTLTVFLVGRIDTNNAPVIMDKLLRGVVIPNEQAIRHLYKVL